MITGVSTNYTGRKVDLSIFPTMMTAGVPAIAQFSNKTKGIAGPSRELQRYAIALLTPLGHYRSDPTYGSNFLQKLWSSQLRFNTDLNFLFIKETQRVLEWLAVNRPANTPTDEMLASVTLVSSNLTLTSVNITANAVMQSDDALTLLLPINWSQP